eukprot:comp11744_c0_seq1/m.6334 comp11744_c0_seq1/g.6334  ORF comp11744_c0_seq1/g.6334 comp11744_c0_seq1/m.6334 type:complete len:1221 (-) comp11744_c0_seq1:759-4421(-)
MFLLDDMTFAGGVVVGGLFIIAIEAYMMFKVFTTFYHPRNMGEIQVNQKELAMTRTFLSTIDYLLKPNVNLLSLKVKDGKIDLPPRPDADDLREAWKTPTCVSSGRTTEQANFLNQFLQSVFRDTNGTPSLSKWLVSTLRQEMYAVESIIKGRFVRRFDIRSVKMTGPPPHIEDITTFCEGSTGADNVLLTKITYSGELTMVFDTELLGEMRSIETKIVLGGLKGRGLLRLSHSVQELYSFSFVEMPDILLSVQSQLEAKRAEGLNELLHHLILTVFASKYVAPNEQQISFQVATDLCLHPDLIRGQGKARYPPIALPKDCDSHKFDHVLLRTKQLHCELCAEPGNKNIATCTSCALLCHKRCVAKAQALGFGCVDLSVQDQMVEERRETTRANRLRAMESRPVMDGDYGDGGLITLEVKVVGATDCIPMDTNGRSDPYCLVSVGPVQFKTRRCNATLNPQYDETFEFTYSINMLPQLLRVTMYDWDVVGKDDFMGQVVIDISSLTTQKLVKETYIMLGRDNVEAGNIELQFYLREVGNQGQISKQLSRKISAAAVGLPALGGPLSSNSLMLQNPESAKSDPDTTNSNNAVVKIDTEGTMPLSSAAAIILLRESVDGFIKRECEHILEMTRFQVLFLQPAIDAGHLVLLGENIVTLSQLLMSSLKSLVDDVYTYHQTIQTDVLRNKRRPVSEIQQKYVNEFLSMEIALENFQKYLKRLPDLCQQVDELMEEGDGKAMLQRLRSRDGVAEQANWQKDWLARRALDSAKGGAEWPDIEFVPLDLEHSMFCSVRRLGMWRMEIDRLLSVTKPDSLPAFNLERLLQLVEQTLQEDGLITWLSSRRAMIYGPKLQPLLSEIDQKKADLTAAHRGCLLMEQLWYFKSAKDILPCVGYLFDNVLLLVEAQGDSMKLATKPIWLVDQEVDTFTPELDSAFYQQEHMFVIENTPAATVQLLKTGSEFDTLLWVTELQTLIVTTLPQQTVAWAGPSNKKFKNISGLAVNMLVKKPAVVTMTLLGSSGNILGDAVTTTRSFLEKNVESVIGGKREEGKSKEGEGSLGGPSSMRSVRPRTLSATEGSLLEGAGGRQRTGSTMSDGDGTTVGSNLEFNAEIDLKKYRKYFGSAVENDTLLHKTHATGIRDSSKERGTLYISDQHFAFKPNGVVARLAQKTKMLVTYVEITELEATTAGIRVVLTDGTAYVFTSLPDPDYVQAVLLPTWKAMHS